MLILYLTVLSVSLYWVVKTLLPEMLKPPLVNTPSRPRSSYFDQPIASGDRLEKLETLLSEKNTNISLLQAELRILYVQVRNFDKIKLLLEEEIHRLKEQNRIFRSELGIPAIASSAEHKENSIM